jgi:hypothetical protein
MNINYYHEKRNCIQIHLRATLLRYVIRQYHLDNSLVHSERSSSQTRCDISRCEHCLHLRSSYCHHVKFQLCP